MADPIQAYPLAWPAGWKRTSAGNRRYGHFNKKEMVRYESGGGYQSSKALSIADGTKRVLESLQKMGIRSRDVVISTDLQVRNDGLPRSGQRAPADPGAAVYWLYKRDAPMRCMAIDGYTKIEDNLAAIAATLEAMRAIERHGGAAILDRAFTGFKALAAENAGPSWWSVLEVEATASEAEINVAWKKLARLAHPDNKETGSDEAIRALNIARDQGIAAAKGRA